MEKITLKKWDSAQHLKTEKDIAEYFDACLEEAGDDSSFIAKSLGVIARARGINQLAKDAGMSSEGLNLALSGEGSPEFDTIFKVVRALGLRLHVSL